MEGSSIDTFYDFNKLPQDLFEKNQKELILMQFGEYIDCFFQFAKKEDEKNDQKEFFLKEFKLFKEAYPDILNNYFLWNETNKNEQKIIIDIFKNL